MPSITLLGLGPGNPAQLTREAWDILSSADEVYLRTRHHRTVQGLPKSVKIFSFDHLYDGSETFEEVYQSIVEQVMELGRREKGVVYAVPGDPCIAEATGLEIVKRAKESSMPLKLVNGISFLEPVFAALGLDPFPRLMLMDAIELSEEHIASFPPDVPVLIAQIYSQMMAAEVKMTLNTVYPDEYTVSMVHAAGTEDEVVEEIPLYEMDRSKHIGLVSTLYLPPLKKGTSFESFQEIVAHLRAPNGCPWDREQTHKSLRPHLLEEAYETLAALDAGDPAGMAEEFGDLLLQIVLNAQIASEAGDFKMTDVLKGIHDKIVNRHPHVFGEVQLEGVAGVLKNWEKIKAEERRENRQAKGLMDGVPLSLPALTQAQEYQDRATRVGFDWSEIEGVLDKVAEEIGEVREVTNEDELNTEIGDLFFTLVNLARWKKVDAESALREANKRFKKRFAHIEARAEEQGKKLTEMTMDEMEVLWQEAKKG
jgi:tetrapyrrole methylase family protein / MazG family protein